MASSINDFRRSKLFRAAIIVPTVIALIFSIFNLTAPNDPEKISSNFKLGIVNLDKSKSFPLLSTQAIKSISRSLPFRVGLFKDSENAKTALAKGEISSVIIFPEDFSEQALGKKSISVKVINSDHLTASETQIASQLPSTFQLGLLALLLIVPVVFYQPALSGTVIPLTAAPEWLELIGASVPFDSIGRAYRSVIFGSSGGLPLLWLASAAFIGLLLNWGSDILRGRMKRRW